jgi:hypothetical protein
VGTLFATENLLKPLVLGARMKILISLITICLTLSAYADETTVFFKKIVDPNDQSVMLLGCTTAQMNSCRVLGGGSISAREASSLHNTLMRIHKLKNSERVFLATGMGLLMTLPSGPGAILLAPATAAVVLLGSTIYISFDHKNYDSYKKVELFDQEVTAKQKIEITSMETIDAFDKMILKLRQDRLL